MRFRKYRRLVFCLFLISLAGLGFYSYLYLKDQVPNRILVEEGTEVSSIFQDPYSRIITEEVIEADSRRSSDIPESRLHRTGGEEIKKSPKAGASAIQCSLFGLFPLKTVRVETAERKKLYAAGIPVGIYIRTSGILVIGTGEVVGVDGKNYEPAEHILKTGDYIIQADGHTVETKEELVECIQNSAGRKMQLGILRNGEKKELTVLPVQTGEKEYKAGIWVRNDAQGVGTLTYIDQEYQFGALGHGISDVDTSTLLTLKTGKLYQAEVISVKRGERGEPGELSGVIYYGERFQLGDITKNTGSGIFGVWETGLPLSGMPLYEMAYRQEIRTGPAEILCSVRGKTMRYEVQIERVDLNREEVNKGMVLRVTDAALLEQTGGIVQGMSGSPIIQDGKMIGAVTHVFVNDPTRGYGIFIEEMLEK